MTASRAGFLEFVRFAEDESASPTNGYCIKVSDFKVDFEQNAKFKDYSEKGVDTTVYTLSGTSLSASFSSPLKEIEVGLYKLLAIGLAQFNERTSVAPTTFSLYSTYYGTLHGCVIEEISIDANEGGPIDINFTLSARYLDFTTREITQLSLGFLDLPETRTFMFYDISLAMDPSYVNFNMPSLADFSSYIKTFSLKITNVIQVNWTLAEQTDISSNLSPQNIVAPKDITMGGRTVEGNIGYIMPHTDLFGFFKVLQNVGPLEFIVFDSLGGDGTYMTIDINNPVFLLPDRANEIGVLQQTASFRGLRSQVATGYSGAINYSHRYE